MQADFGSPPSPTFDLLLRSARVDAGPPVDIGIRAGAIVSIGSAEAGEATHELRLDGRVVLPAFVEAHTHLDKSLTFALALNQSGTLHEAIERMHEVQATDTAASVYQRAAATARQFVAQGTTTIRTHVDVNRFTQLRGVEALLRLREDLSGLARLQLVALTHPLSGENGSVNLALVEEALRMGVDAIGGAPALTDDPRAEIDLIFALALRTGKPIDLHVDESDTPADFCLPYLAKKTIAERYQGMVTAGHCCSLAAVDDDAAARAIDLVREAGIGVVTLPSANMYLQGRRDMGCVRRGLTRVGQLIASGVPVACGSDNIRDPFNPFGRPDQLLVANLLAHAAHMGSPTEQARVIEAITSIPARMLGLAETTIAPDRPADMVVLDTEDAAGILADVPARRFVIANGKLVAETRTSTWVHSPVAVS